MLVESSLSRREFKRVRDLVYQHCGIHLHDGKMDLVRARIAKRLRARNLETIEEYLDLVEGDTSGSEVLQLIDEMSTNLTSFFREPEHFTHLREQLLPALLERKRAQGSNRLRF